MSTRVSPQRVVERNEQKQDELIDDAVVLFTTNSLDEFDPKPLRRKSLTQGLQAIMAPVSSSNSGRSLQLRQEVSFSTDLNITHDNSARQALSGINQEIDWYGNTLLHQAFVRLPFDFEYARHVVQRCPHFARQRNQFGRLPLHYALDRSKTSPQGLKLLLDAYPGGAAVLDQNGDSPYDLACKWQLSRKVRRLLLEAAPDIDPTEHMRLKYGPLGSLAAWAASSFSLAGTNLNEADEEEDEADGDNQDQDNANGRIEEEGEQEEDSALLGDGHSSLQVSSEDITQSQQRQQQQPAIVLGEGGNGGGDAVYAFDYSDSPRGSIKRRNSLQQQQPSSSSQQQQQQHLTN